MSQLLSLEEVQKIWEEVQSRFTVYEKTYLIPVTHLRSKGSLEILANLKDYRCFKTHDKYSHSKVIQTDENRKPDEFRVANNLWYLDNKPVYYKWKHTNVFDISDLPEFCMNSYCPLYRDIDENNMKYYYVNEDSYDDYLREKEGKKSKIDEIAENANELYNHILKIEKALKHASTFDEFKSFCLDGCYDIGKHANAAGCTPKEPVNTENKTPKEEPTEEVEADADEMHLTADRLAEFNLEAYKEEVEACIDKARNASYMGYKGEIG